MALQNSILHWASDHRVHHRHVDENDKDPYSAKKRILVLTHRLDVA